MATTPSPRTRSGPAVDDHHDRAAASRPRARRSARTTSATSTRPDAGAGGYDVDHYDLDIAWDPESGELDGVTTITATATQDLSRFSVDLIALETSRGDGRR